jgi:hypothetical protein
VIVIQGKYGKRGVLILYKLEIEKIFIEKIDGLNNMLRITTNLFNSFTKDKLNENLIMRISKIENTIVPSTTGSSLTNRDVKLSSGRIACVQAIPISHDLISFKKIKKYSIEVMNSFKDFWKLLKKNKSVMKNKEINLKIKKLNKESKILIQKMSNFKSLNIVINQLNKIKTEG